MTTTIYSALYCPCIYESAHATISLHRTHKGAVEAITKHRADMLLENKKWWEECDVFPTLESTIENERWDVKEMELFD